MADYNSAYTGAEVDAAVAKAGWIMRYQNLWKGNSTSFPISNLPANPGIPGGSSRAGIYEIVYEDPSGSTGDSNISRVYIPDESKHHAGVGIVWIDGSTVHSSFVDFNNSGSGAFRAVKQVTGQSDTTMTMTEIWRLEYMSPPPNP